MPEAERVQSILKTAAAIALLAATVLAAAPGAGAETTVDGLVAEDTTWTLAGSPYVLTGDLRVAGHDGADGVTTLTIEPGVEVRLAPGVSLHVGGTALEPGALVAEGTPLQPILFTSSLPATGRAPGAWDAIVFEASADGAASRLVGAIVEYGGGDGRGLVRVNDSSPLIAGNLLRLSAAHGIHGEGRWAGALVENNTFDANARAPVLTSPWGAGRVGVNDWSANGASQAVEVYGDRLEIESNWSAIGTPFRVDGRIVVTGTHGPDNVTRLRFGEGVQVNFTAGSGIDVGECCSYPGALAIEGTLEAPVLLTSDEPAGAKTPGHWDGIRFLDSAHAPTSRVDNATFEYGGSGGAGMLRLEWVSVPVHGGAFRHSASYGLHTTGTASEPVVHGVAFHDNALGHARLQANGVRLLTGGAFSGGAGDIEVVTGRVWQDARWTDQGVPYRLTGTLYVGGTDGDDARTGLELGPGVRLEFPPGARLDAYGYTYYYCCSYYNSYYGYVTVDGTAEAPVVLTSTNATKAPGQWGGLDLRYQADLGFVANVTVEAAGGDGRAAVVIEDGTPQRFENVTIVDSASDGLSLECPTSPVLVDVKILRVAGHGLHQDSPYSWSGCAPELRSVHVEGAGGRAARLWMGTPRDGLTLVSNAVEEIELGVEEVRADTTLAPARDRDTGAPYAYALTTGLTVRDDATLTLAPATTLRFPQYASLNVGLCCSSGAYYSGHLDAVGTAAEPVTLESRADAPGWYGVFLEGYGHNPDPAQTLVNVTIAGSVDDGLHLRRFAAGTYDNVTVRDNARHGVYAADGSSVTWRSLRAERNGAYGLYEDSNSKGAHLGPTFVDNLGRPARIRVDNPLVAPTLEGNALREIELWGVDVDADQRLERHLDARDGAPYAYAILNDFTVRNLATLTFDAGLTVLMADQVDVYAGACCSNVASYRGAIVAEGTVDLPILFLNRTPTSTSSWGGLHVEGGAAGESRMPSVFRNVTASGTRDHGFTILRTSLGTFDNLTTDGSLLSGLRLYAAPIAIQGWTARDNVQHGILIESASNPVTVVDALVERTGGNGVTFLGSGNALSLANATLRGSGGYGLYAGDTWGSTGDLADVIIEGSGARPWRLSPWSLVENVTLRDNAIVDLEWTRGDVARRAVTWALHRDADSGEAYTHTILNGVSFADGGGLTIAPGVTARFATNAWLDIGRCCLTPAHRNPANLTAEGTAEAPIALVALTGDRATGWNGILVRGDNVVGDSPALMRNVTISGSKDDALQTYAHDAVRLDNVTLRDAARFGLYADHSYTPRLENVAIEDTGSHGIYVEDSASVDLVGGAIRRAGGYGVYHANANFPGAYAALTVEDGASRPLRVRLDTPLEGLTLRAHAAPEIELYGVDLPGNLTLPRRTDADTGEAYDHAFLTYVNVRNARTLLVEPGQTLRFDNAAGIGVGGCCNTGDAHRGALLAEGTAEAPIRFVNRTPVSTSAWYGIDVDGSAAGTARMETVLRNVTIEGSRDNGLQTIRTGALGVWDNVTATDNLHAGVLFDADTSGTLQGAHLARNGLNGNLRLRNDARFVVQDALIEGGADHGVALEQDASYAILKNVTVRDNARYGVYGYGAWGGRADMADVRIEGNGERPWRLSPWSDLTGVTLSGHFLQDLEWLRGDVGANRTWPLYVDGASGEAYTYTARDGVRIYDGATLTLEAGVEVRFAQNAWMDVGWCCHSPNTRNRAGLVAEGTVAAPIRLVAESGDRASGWYGLLLQGDGIAGDLPATLRNVTISGSKDDALQVHGHDNATLDAVRLADAARYGLYASTAFGPAASDLVVEDTGNHGIYTDGSAAVDLAGGVVRRAGGYGVYHANANAAGAYRDLLVEEGASRPMRVRLDTPVEGLSLRANAIRQVELYGVDVASDRTLPLHLDLADLQPHALVLLSSFTVHSGATLTVPAGSTVLLAQDVRIFVGRCCFHSSLDPGALLAEGTTASPITFGAATGSRTTGWRGLHFDGRSNYGERASVLRNVTLRESKVDLVELQGHASLTMRDVAFLDYASSGVYAHTTSVVAIAEARFFGGNYGVFARDARVEAAGANATGQSVHALYLERAHGSTVERADLTTANATAIRLLDTDNSVLRTNRLRENALGIKIESSSTGNLLYDNLFRNTANANDLAASTRWNTTATPGINVCGGPLVGGNCWSDYAGNDTDGDGFGDTDAPHRAGIAGVGDELPLMVRPFADFTWAPVDGATGLLRFEDLSVGPIHPVASWTWDFGDGASSTDQNPLHDYDAEGLFAVTLTVTDTHGNVGNRTRNVLLDTVPPLTTGALSGAQGDAGWWISNVTVTLNATDNQSGISDVLYRFGAVGDFLTYAEPLVLAQDGLSVVEYYAVDLGGNAEPVRRLEVPIDRTAALTHATIDGPLHAVGWYTSNVTASLEATDATSGVNATYYVLDGGDVAAYAAPILVAGTGIHALDPFTRDVAGNLEEPTRLLVRIDLTPPSSRLDVGNGTPGTNGWWRSAVDVGLLADDEGAGVAGLDMGLDGAPLAPYLGPARVSTEGVHAAAHRATDLVDLVEATRESLVGVDLTAPDLDVDLAGTLHPTGWYTTAPRAFLNATDATSGVAGIEWRLDGGGFANYTTPVVIGTTGTHTLEARALDLAGHLAEAAPLTVKVDLGPPVTAIDVLTGTHGTGAWYRSSVTLGLDPDDGSGSGVLATTYSVDGGLNQTYVPGTSFELSGEGLHDVRATSSDIVGHVESARQRLVGVDLSPPATTPVVDGVLNEETGTYWGRTVVGFVGADAVSGVHRVDYWVNGAGPYNAANPLVLTAQGAYNLTFRALDLALNAEPLQYLNLTLDLDITPPVSAATLSGTQGASPWYRTPVNVTLAATDLEAGVALLEYRFDDEANWTAYNGTFTVATEALHDLQFRATDLVGNVETTKLKTFGVDLAGPVASSLVEGPIGADGWYRGPANVTLGAFDNLSGLQSLRYRIGNGSYQNVQNPIQLTSSGIHVLDWLTLDRAGNAANGTMVIRLDFEAPTAVANVTGLAGNDTAWWRSNVSIALDATDLVSGVSRIEYSLDGGAFVPYVGPIEISSEGDHTLRFTPFDLVGNQGLLTTLNIRVDLTTPILKLSLDESLTIIIDETIVVRERLCIEFEGLDALSGLKELTIKVIGVVSKVIVLDAFVSFHCIELPDGEYELQLIGCDHAGWCTLRGFPFKVDNGPPVIWLVRPSPGSVMVQNVSAPVFRSLFQDDRALLIANASGIPAAPDLPAEPPETPEVPGWPDEAPLTDPREGDYVNLTYRSKNESLARTTVVVGPRVPIWISAYDTTGVAEVEFLLDGVPIGKARHAENHTILTAGLEQNNILDENGPVDLHVHQRGYRVYVVTIDTLGMAAGEHHVTMRARDILGAQSSATFSFIFQSGEQFAHAADAIVEALDSVEVPPELEPQRAWLKQSVQYLVPRVDNYARDNYVFLDEELVEFYRAYDPIIAAPGFAAEDDWGFI